MLRLSFSNYTTADNSDYFGILASGLCLIHCFATPFIFIVRSCSAACCAETPIWWKTIDYLFVIISLFAVRQAFKASDNKLIKSGFINVLLDCKIDKELIFERSKLPQTPSDA